MRRVLGGRHALLGAGIVLVAAFAIFAVLILAEDDPPAIAEEELPAGCQPGLPHITCTYTSSTRFSFDSMVSQLESAYERQIGSSTPVWVQAWGGRGAKGATWEGYSGAYGGYAGYAISVQSVGDLGGKTLYLYVGANGSKHANYSGQGGASSIVSTQPVSQGGAFPGGLIAVAAGSGGGGKAGEECWTGRGGNGGVAIATGQNVGGSGQNGDGPTQGWGGYGGQGGAGGGTAGTTGANGTGGYGGAGNSAGSPAGWVNVEAVDPAAAGWNAGAGGEGRGGGGGGGYGGGGGGGECKWVAKAENAINGGGGGGASWALGNAVGDSGAPTDSRQADGVSSKIVLTIDVS
ncbi:MAG TPA: hypothetical protein VF729_02730 [Solirubrobacterales bacterium]